MTDQSYQKDRITVFLFADGSVIPEREIIEHYSCLIGQPLVQKSGRHDAGVLAAIEQVRSEDGVLYLFIRVDFEDGDSQWGWLRAPTRTTCTMTGLEDPRGDK